MRRKQRGFTLVELVIVIAVLAIVAAIAIPVVSSIIGDARQSTCLSNRAALQREASYEVMKLDGSVDAVMARFTPETIREKGYVCVGSSGEIRLSYDPVSHSFSAYCTQHGGLEVHYDFADTIGRYMEGSLGSKIVELLGSRQSISQIDSTAPEGGNFAGPIRNCLAELSNHSIGAGMTATWSLCNIERSGKEIKETYQVYWSSADITTAQSGNQILMMKYNAKTGVYEAGWATVKQTKDTTVGGGKDYNVIVPGSFQTLSASSSKDFMTAYRSFQDALEESGSGIKSGS